MKAHERPATKQCRKCGQQKPLTEFYAKGPCKPCWLARCAEYRRNNQDKIKRYLRGWYKENRERVLKRTHEYQSRPERKLAESLRQRARYAQNRDEIMARRREYYERNSEARERFRIYQQNYAKEHKDKFNARSGRRRAARKNALPAWADRKAIAEFYILAQQKTRDTGIRHVVDHIIPLQGKSVCGLHVEKNLQVIPEKENLKKFNKFG